MVFYVGTNIKPVPLEDVLATPASQIAYQEVGILTRVISEAENFIPAAPCMECEEKETISAVAASTGDVEPFYVLYLSPEEVCARQCVDPVFLTDYDPQEVDITARTADEGQAGISNTQWHSGRASSASGECVNGLKVRRLMRF